MNTSTNIKMNKRDIKLAFYKEEILKYEEKPNFDLLEAITKYLGPSIHNADSELVSTSDEKEVNTVKKSFLKRKLKLSRVDEDILDLAIISVRDIFGTTNTKKYRALFYYFLTKKFQLEKIFVDNKKEIKTVKTFKLKKGIDLDKLEKIAKINKENITIRKSNRKNYIPTSLLIAIFFDVLIILILLILLSK